VSALFCSCPDGPHVGSRARVPRHALAARAVLTAARCAQGLLDARGPVEEVVERVAAALARTITRCPGSRPPVRPCAWALSLAPGRAG